MSTFREFTFTSVNGTTPIHVRRFDPEGAPRGVVQIAHGVAEYANRYDPFLRFLADNGFVAVAHDHLGHGKSVTDDSELGWFAEKGGWDLVVSDVKKLHDMLQEEFPDLPFVLFGHSMGSFVARTYLIRYPEDLNAAVICGTGQQSAALVGGGKLMANLVCTFKGTKHRSKFLNGLAFGSYNKAFEPLRTQVDWLSRDTAVVDAYDADPLCGFMATAGLFRDMMGGISFIGKPANVAKVRKDLPVFLIAGAMDPVGEQGKGPQRALELYRQVGLADATLKLYPDCRHELLNELNKEEVMADILAFLNEKLA